MRTDELEVGQHVSCMYALAKGWVVVNGVVRKITPKTFTVDVGGGLDTVNKFKVLSLKLFSYAE